MYKYILTGTVIIWAISTVGCFQVDTLVQTSSATRAVSKLIKWHTFSDTGEKLGHILGSLCRSFKKQ
jgi:hypothetical protein